MKKKHSDRDTTKFITQIAIGQSITGKTLAVGKGMVSSPTTETPFKIIDQAPVYHISKNSLHPQTNGFNRNSARKLGFFYHPYLMIGMPSIGGKVHFYCDPSNKGWFILWSRTKLDSWAFNETMPFSDPEIIAWTPRIKGDNVYKAGSRMLRAFFLDYSLTEDGIYAEESFKSQTENGYPYGNDFIEFCAGAVMKTEHTSEEELGLALASCPDYLREYYRHQAVIKPTE